ncbi:MAG: hypothetical protein WAN92_05170 [Herbaspirillum sp.]
MTTSAIAPRTPRDPKAKPIAIPLTPDEIRKTDKYASSEVRSRATFARMIFLRGLEAYEDDLVNS